MSTTNADASRIAAYCEITAKIPVAADTAIAKYFTASVALAKLPNPAITKIPISTRDGAICAEIICDLFSFHNRNSSFSFTFNPHFSCLNRPQWPIHILNELIISCIVSQKPNLFVTRGIIGLLRAAHFVPTLTVTVISYVLSWQLSDITTAFGITATVFMGQLVVGWTNDYRDYSDDLVHNRQNKPLVSGLITLKILARATYLAVFALLALTYFGPLAGKFGFAHLLAVASAVAYNFRLKSTAISFLPFAFSFGLLPVIILGATGGQSELWMVSIGALFGVGVHLANVFKDLENDRASGIYGLPQKLGIRRSRFGCAISFGGGGLILALNTAEQSAWLIVLASIIFLIPLPRKYIFPFAMALGLAVMAVFIAAIG